MLFHLASHKPKDYQRVSITQDSVWQWKTGDAVEYTELYFALNIIAC